MLEEVLIEGKVKALGADLLHCACDLTVFDGASEAWVLAFGLGRLIVLLVNLAELLAHLKRFKLLFLTILLLAPLFLHLEVKQTVFHFLVDLKVSA